MGRNLDMVYYVSSAVSCSLFLSLSLCADAFVSFSRPFDKYVLGELLPTSGPFIFICVAGPSAPHTFGRQIERIGGRNKTMILPPLPLPPHGVYALTHTHTHRMGRMR